jgi:HSP20 family protein
MVERYSKPDDSHSESDRPPESQYLNPDPFNWRLAVRSPAWQPPADVYETEQAIIVRVEIAGMREGDFSIELNGRSLSIRGTRPDLAERRAYHQMEIRFGEFLLEMELPAHVDIDQVQAVYNNGFLRVSLPIARPRQIPIIE